MRSPDAILSRPRRWLALALLCGSTSVAAQESQLLLCAGCHGMNGEGRPGAGYPRIAGQPAAYLLRQLDAFASGLRKSRIMEPLARRLTTGERVRVVVHFAGQYAPSGPRAFGDALRDRRAETLATVGDADKGMRPCQDCHGVGGQGNPPSHPYLAGLSRDYLRGELAAWKNGTRQTDSSGDMRHIAARMSAEEIDALAAYYAGLPPPPTPRAPARSAK